MVRGLRSRAKRPCNSTTSSEDEFEMRRAAPVTGRRKRSRRAAYGDDSSYEEESDRDGSITQSDERMNADDSDEGATSSEGEPSELEYLTAVEKILSCSRQREASPSGSDRDYFVKWKDKSYAHCSWVTGTDLKGAVKEFPRHLLRKFNKFEQDYRFQVNEDFADSNGIDPDFLTVHRVLAHKVDKRDKAEAFYIKWKSLNYDEATWESRGECEGLKGFPDALSKFESRSSLYSEVASLGEKDPFERTKFGVGKRKFKAYEEDPDFIKGSDGVSGAKGLFPYQLEGLNWLRFSWTAGKHVILGDEMGLGKTIQAITFISSLRSQGYAYPHIVVAPLSTLANWEREFQKWAPDLNVVSYCGNRDCRHIIKGYEFFVPKRIMGGSRRRDLQMRAKFHVLLTTYEMAMVETGVLNCMQYGCLIVDEGHRLKNRSSKLFQVLSNFSAYQRILLTGTPLQNNLEELFMLLHFMDPKKFDDLRISKLMDKYSDIEREEQIKALHNLLKPHLLRRLKTDVLKDLPPKKEQIVLVELSDAQKDLYRRLLTKNYDTLVGPDSAGVSSLKNLLMQLRKCCNHPSLVTQDFSKLNKRNIVRFTKQSGKMELFGRILEKLLPHGHRILVYSQFVTVLDMLEEWLEIKGISCLSLDGSVKGSSRQDLIDKFNTEPDECSVFLLSTRAGGVGINLATADTVVIFDSDWNPHNDLQAQSRAHRLGQEKEVMTYRFVSRATVEERMIQRTKQKMVLEHLVVRKASKGMSISQNELDDILKYGVTELFGDDQISEAKKTSDKGDDGAAEGSNGDNSNSGDGPKNKVIYYDDVALDRLLDRTVAWVEDPCGGVKEENEYLNTFKVADFELQEENSNEQKSNEDGDDDDEKGGEKGAGFWEKLLHEEHRKRVDEQEALGKGKRERKAVITDTGLDYLDVPDSPEYSRDESFEPPKSGERESSSDTTSNQGTQASDGLDSPKEQGSPPFISTRGKTVHVLGFSKSERMSFYKSFMRYGPGVEKGESGFAWTEIKRVFSFKKPEEVQAYAQKWVEHLSEPPNNDICFADGVPKEELLGDGRTAALERMATLHFLGKAVNDAEGKPEKEFNCLHDLISMSTRHWKPYMDLHLIRAVLKHGYGSWMKMSEDPAMGINRFLLEELANEFPGIGDAMKRKEKATTVAAAEVMAEDGTTAEETIGSSGDNTRNAEDDTLIAKYRRRCAMWISNRVKKIAQCLQFTHFGITTLQNPSRIGNVENAARSSDPQEQKQEAEQAEEELTITASDDDPSVYIVEDEENKGNAVSNGKAVEQMAQSPIETINNANVPYPNPSAPYPSTVGMLKNMQLLMANPAFQAPNQMGMAPNPQAAAAFAAAAATSAMMMPATDPSQLAHSSYLQGTNVNPLTAALLMPRPPLPNQFGMPAMQPRIQHEQQQLHPRNYRDVTAAEMLQWSATQPHPGSSTTQLLRWGAAQMVGPGAATQSPLPQYQDVPPTNLQLQIRSELAQLLSQVRQNAVQPKPF